MWTPPPIPLFSAAQVYALDRAAIAAGTPGFALMTRAGRAASDLAQRDYLAGLPAHGRRVAVVCGGGNNGGDGYVVAQQLHEAGVAVQLWWLVAPDALQNDAALAASAAIAAGVAIAPFADTTEFTDVALIVDALFGIGLDRPPAGLAAAAIVAMNRVTAPVLALDIPSGLHADSGQPLGVAVHADATLCFIAYKWGLFTGQGPAHRGRVTLATLGVTADLADDEAPHGYLLGRDCPRPPLTPRRPTAHKGDHGHVLVIGGDAGLGGAALLCGMAAARVGAGLVTLATHPDHAAALMASYPTLMVKAIHHPDDLAPLLARATAVALGPGLGQGDWGRSLFAATLHATAAGDGASTHGLVIDADGLNCLAIDAHHRTDWVLTPHPGEAARLLCTTTVQIERDRRAAVTEIARQFGGTALLKGAGTLVKHGDAPPWVLDVGNPGMATAGMGDVLTGVIVGLLAQGLPPVTATLWGAWFHGAAGDGAAESGPRGMVATDLLPHLRILVNP